MIEDNLIDDLREVRISISNEFENNTELLIEHYIAIQNENNEKKNYNLIKESESEYK